ncbi:class I SAM-dependent RNA methyltransferase [Gracilinema caldarium]|uniref:THUMP domain-containing class I SAM-dependent RNA methyltransferase n=1 Tax=Gracilinema caldarium TaxID=215591 RepID=UPI0026EC5634|nr:class I SAM-dependent RNA methyltransferase [Gracilinema caldarium]
MMNFVALCAIGAEKALSNELHKLNIAILDSTYGKIRFSADTEGMYRALLSLRTADRVLLEAASFSAANFDALFDGCQNVNWEAIIPKTYRVVIGKVRSSHSQLSAETSIQAVVHKAIAERLCRVWGVTRLPEYGEAADIRVYIEKDRVQILLDLCGEPLFKRGYRTEGGAAPLRETTAAAMLLLSGWRRKYPLYDPFCGSGTILIEAALYAWGAAPGLGRDFAVSSLLIGDRNIESRLREELRQGINFANRIRIYGSDADGRAVSIAQSNLIRAYELILGKEAGRGIRIARDFVPPSEYWPQIHKCSMETAMAPENEPGFIVTNPPYGERLGDREEAEQTYQAMGVLEKHFSGWNLSVITNHPGFESFFGRRAQSVRNITNGALKSYLYQFENLGRNTNVNNRRT